MPLIPTIAIVVAMISDAEGEEEPSLRRMLGVWDGPVLTEEDAERIEGEGWTWPGYKVSKTYDVCRGDDAEHGEPSERGYKYEDEVFPSLEEMLNYDTHSWETGEKTHEGFRMYSHSEEDWSSDGMESTCYALHIQRVDGDPFSEEEMRYIHRREKIYPFR